MAADRVAGIADFFETQFQWLRGVPSQAVSDCYVSLFLDYENDGAKVPKPEELDPPVEAFKDLLEQAWRDILRYFKDPVENEDLLQQLETREVNLKKLCVMLWPCMEEAVKPSRTLADTSLGLTAAALYVSLCSMNEAKRKGVYHATLIRMAITVFLRAAQLYHSSLSAEQGGAAKKKKKAGGNKGGKTAQRANADQTVLVAEDNLGTLKVQIVECMAVFYPFLEKVGILELLEGKASNELCDFLRDVVLIDMREHRDDVQPLGLGEFLELRTASGRSLCMSFLLARFEKGTRLLLARIIMPRLLYWPVGCEELSMPGTVNAFMLSGKDLAVALFKGVLAQCGDNVERRIMVSNVALRVLQACMVKFKDAADVRLKVTESIVDMLKCMDTVYVHHFADFLCVCNTMTKPAFRSFFAEVSAVILRRLSEFGNFENRLPPLPAATAPQVDASNTTQAAEEPETSGHERTLRPKPKKKSDAEERPHPLKNICVEEGLLQVVVRGLTDKSSAVAQRSLQVLPDLLQHYEEKVTAEAGPRPGTLQPFIDSSQKILKDILNDYGAEEGEEDHEVSDSVWTVALSTPTATNAFLNLIVLRSEDSTATGRRMAIKAIEALYKYLSDEREKAACVDKLEARARDEATTIRKQAAESLTKLVLSPDCCDDDVKRAWLGSVLQLVLDRETQVTTAVTALVNDVIIKPICDEDSVQVWDLLTDIEKDTAQRRLLVTFLHNQFKSRSAYPGLVANLFRQTKIEAHRDSAWMLLADMSSFMPTHVALEQWAEVDYGSEDKVVTHAAKFLANRCEKLRPEERADLERVLHDGLVNYKFNVQHISWVFYAYACLLNATGDEPPGLQRLIDFNKQLVERILRRIEASIYIDVTPICSQQPNPAGTQSDDPTVDDMNRMLDLLGECVVYTPEILYGPNVTSVERSHLVRVLKTIIAADYVSKMIKEDIMTGRATAQAPAPNVPAAPPAAGIDGAAAATGADGGAPGAVPQGGTQKSAPTPTRQLKSWLLTAEVRAHAVVALGKVLLQDEQTAQSCIPVLVKQMKENAETSMRNNISFVVCDLCLRYTSQIDRYIGILAMCLRDRSVLIRNQSLLLLTNLVKEGFLKWKGQLMYHFLMSLLDSEDAVRTQAEFCIVDVLLPQFPTMFQDNFLTCMRYFNGLPIDALHNDDGGKTTPGLNDQRIVEQMAVMDDKAKMNVLFAIAAGVFEAIAEGRLDIERREVVSLFTDACQVFMTQECKLSLATGRVSADPESDDQPPEAVQSAAKKAVADMYRGMFMKRILPGFVGLKNFLVGRRSNHIALLYDAFLELCKDHRQSLDIFLQSDPQLKAEVQYDLVKLENRKKKELEKQRRDAEREERRRNQPQQPEAPNTPLANTPRIERILEGRTPRRMSTVSEEAPAVVDNQEMGRIVLAPSEGTPRTRRRSVGSLLRALATDSRKNPRTRRIEADLSPRDRRTRRSLPTDANLMHMSLSPLAVPRSQPEPVAAAGKTASPQPSTSTASPPQPVALDNARPQFVAPSVPPRVLAGLRDISTPTQTFCEVTFNHDVSTIPTVVPPTHMHISRKRPHAPNLTAPKDVTEEDDEE
ncbi:condensin-2 complex subunit D3-like protein [Aphelenchoides avenae]|nr:condensin-2 complex subunit D3-like protein [Aphelenchus avenae]